MLNYTDAKELKDAGFPQDTQFYWVSKMKDLEVRPFVRLGGKEKGECANPTLSELIEACGEEFYQLTKTQDTNPYHAYNQVSDIIGAGKSPEQAVKNLWIAINNNK